MRLSVLVMASLLLAAAAGPAQTPPPKPEPARTPEKSDDTQFRITVPLVNVPFTVLDQKDRLVVDLRREDFEVFEDGQKVPIRFFTSITKVPLRIGLLMDTSNSVRLHFKAQQTAAIDFIHSITESNPKNRLFLMTFDFTRDLLHDFTYDADALSTLVRKLKPGGGTALYDAIFYACQEKLRYESEEGGVRRVLLIITDGEDDASRHSLDQALDVARRANVSIYAVGTIAYGSTSPGEKVLERLVEETGGRVVYPWKKPPSAEFGTGYLSRTQIDGQNAVYQAGTGKYAGEQAAQLAESLGLVQRELESQYHLAYVPPNVVADGRFREIKVETVHKGLRIRARKGYFAMAAENVPPGAPGQPQPPAKPQ